MKKILMIFFILFQWQYGYAQNNPVYTIGILTSSYSSEVAPLVEQLKERIVAVVGKEATIHFNEDYIRSGQLDLKEIEESYKACIGDPDIDIILAFGFLNNYLLMQKKEFPKPVVLYGAVNQDFINLPRERKTSGIDNLTYLITPESIKEDLNIFSEIYSYQNIGIIINNILIDYFPVKEILDLEFADKTATYTLIPVGDFEISEVNGKLDKVDAVYLTSLLHISDENFRKLVADINTRKLPSFSSLWGLDADSGLLLTRSSSYSLSYQAERFFRRIALVIEDIVMGKNPKDIPILVDYTKKLFFNVETSLQIDFPIRYSQLLSMEMVGDIRNLPFEKRYSLPEVINQVLEKNYGLKGDKENVELARKDLDLARSNYLPDLSASVQGTYIDPDLARVSNGSNPERSTGANITLLQLLFSEEVTADIAIQKQLSKATEQEFNAAQLDTVLEAAVAYFNTLIAKTNFIIQDENLRLTRKNFEIANQKYDAGQSTKLDVLRWKSEVAQATQNLVSTRHNLIKTFIALNEILTNPLDHRIDVEDADLTKGVFETYNYPTIYEFIDDPKLREKFVGFLVDEAKKNAPELKILDHNIKAAQRTSRLYSRLKYMPTITFQGQYNHTFSRDGKGTDYPVGFSEPPDGYYTAGAVVSLPIFQRNQLEINREKSLIQERQFRFQKENLELSLERNVRDIINSLVTRISNIQISKVSADAARESLNLTQTAYYNGAVSITSLIDAQNAYIETQEQQANATYNYLINFLQMERIIGYFFMLHTEEENQNFGWCFLQHCIIKDDTIDEPFKAQIP